MKTDQENTLQEEVTMPSQTLTAKTDEKGNVWIDGFKGKHTASHGKSHTFQFTLDDQTSPKQNVRFDSLDTEDTSNCPPKAGLNSSQIPAAHVHIQNKTASFKDLNNNTSPMDVCYQWVFQCDDGQQPKFDPIIDNRGGGGFI